MGARALLLPLSSSESIHNNVALAGEVCRPHLPNAAMAMEADGGSPTAPSRRAGIRIYPSGAPVKGAGGKETDGVLARCRGFGN